MMQWRLRWLDWGYGGKGRDSPNLFAGAIESFASTHALEACNLLGAVAGSLSMRCSLLQVFEQLPFVCCSIVERADSRVERTRDRQRTERSNFLTKIGGEQR